MFKKLLFNLFFIGCLISNVVFAKTYEQALDLYHRGDYEGAYLVFLELAELGNELAQHNIAVMYSRGEFLDKSLIDAWAWAKLAEQNGAEQSGKLISRIEVNAKKEEIVRAESELASLEHKFSSAVVKERYLSSPSFGSNVASAKPLFLAEPKYPDTGIFRTYGSVDTLFAVGKDGSARYFSAILSPGELFTEEALKSLSKSTFVPATFGGKPQMSFGVTQRYVFSSKNMFFDSNNINNILRWKKLSAIKGGSSEKLAYYLNLSGFYSLYHGQDGFESLNWDSPTRWLVEAAQYGSSYAQFQLGQDILQGRQCKSEPEKGLLWLQRAAESGLNDAKLSLGYHYLAGTQLRQDQDKGLKLIKEAANSGFNHALVLGAWVMLTHPDESIRDFSLGQLWLQALNKKEYADQRSLAEAETALELARGDWKLAAKKLRKLHKLNRKFKVSDERERALRKSLENKKNYIEEL